MALDGFSIRQVGLGQDQTSAQMALNTERAVIQSLSTKGVESIDSSSTNKAITLDEEKEKEKNNKNKSGKRSKKNEQAKVEDAYTVETETSTLKGLEFYNKFSDKLSIRLNRRLEIIELYDKDTKKTVESITASDLMKIIDKLKISSGVLVNRKI